MAQKYGQRWRIAGDLGKGGQSDVFRAVDMSGKLEGEYALKRVRNPARQQRFRNEVEAVRRLDHPNIIKLIDHSALDDVGTDETRQYLVMPIAQDGDLARRAAVYKDSLDSVVTVAKQICAGLSIAHEADIIHRDIKPANILFPSAGHDVWITDFGICLIREQDRITNSGEVMGPWAFMAPELEGGGRLDVLPAADIYSLGKVIYYMITGGVVLPREQLHEPDYSAIFDKGQRHTLLRGLLGKMICPIESRMREITEVMSSLTMIEDWDTRAKLAPVSNSSMKLAERMGQESINNQRIRGDNQVERSKENAEFIRFNDALNDWLSEQLNHTAETIGIGGLAAEAITMKDEFNTQLGSNSSEWVQGVKAIGLSIERTGDVRKQKHALLFWMCKLMRTEVRVISGNEVEQFRPARDLQLVLLPRYAAMSTSGKLNSQWQGFVSSREGLRKMKNYITKSFMGPELSLCMRMPVSQWPSNESQIRFIIEEAVETLLLYIDNGANSTGG